MMIEVFTMKLQSALNFSHTLLKKTVKPGDNVIDGTAGLGHDTLFLAQLVGQKGKVFSFDIQQSAIDATNHRINENEVQPQCEIIHDGHENVKRYINDQPISAAIFNLGYLPTGNKTIITKPATTLKAVSAILNNLTPNGIIILVLYYGHPGGKEEKNQVLDFAGSLDQHQYNVLKYQFINQINDPPILIAIQKRTKSS
ncbi:putative methyltransferase (putative) [Fructilactobacillus fructivorans]|nr:putative methyltransferase (putative) [Fructilactobacillus fructivorans]KRN42306.1 putative methyltransferase (putative) [Fructilactobacillus fructivorans]